VRQTKALAQRIFDYNHVLLRESNELLDEYERKRLEKQGKSKCSH
jgi:hypothetical protein